MENTPGVLPPSGAIYRAFFSWGLTDGSCYAETRSVLILDAARQANGNVRVIWQMMADKSVEDYLPKGEPRVSVFEPSAMYKMDPNIIDWRSIGDGSCVVDLDLYVGTYRPRDPAYNSIEILREYAIKRLETLAKYAPVVED